LDICFVTIGIPSALASINTLVARLVQSGGEFHVISGRKRASGMLSRHCQFAQFNQQTVTRYSDPPDAKSINEPDLPALIDLLEKIQPDLVLIDSEMHIEQLYAEAAGFRVGALEYHVSPDRVRAIPPLSSSFIPDDSQRDRWRCYRIWRQLDRHRRTRPELQAYFQSLDSICGKLSRDYRALADYGHWQPVRFRHIPIVRLAPLALDFTHRGKLSPRFYSNGVEYEAVSSITEAAELQDWISDRQRRLVICTAGSLIHDTRFVDSFIELSKRRDDLDFLIGGVATDSAPVAAANIRVVPFVPQRFALRFADFMLSGAGIATITESVEHGVPLLVVSHGVLDQNGNAARVVHHGVGRRIANREITADRLAQELILLDDALRARVHSVAERLRVESDGNNLIAHLRRIIAGDVISTG